MNLLRRLRTAAVEAYEALQVTLGFYQAMSSGWMRDLGERRLLKPIPDFTRDDILTIREDGKLLLIARRHPKAELAALAIRQLSKPLNLIGAAYDNSMPLTVREAAISLMANQAVLMRIALGEMRHVSLAQAAVENLHDQHALAAILKQSPFVTVRMRAAKRCDFDSALLEAMATDPHEDVRSEARLRFEQLNDESAHDLLN